MRQSRTFGSVGGRGSVTTLPTRPARASHASALRPVVGDEGAADDSLYRSSASCSVRGGLSALGMVGARAGGSGTWSRDGAGYRITNGFAIGSLDRFIQMVFGRV